MTDLYTSRFPNETDDYRDARNKLLQQELALRAQIEMVAEMRRLLPLGGMLKYDYEFRRVNNDQPVRFSQLFENGKNTAVLYNFMFSPDASKPCPNCDALADSFNANARHIKQRINFYIVAKAPVEKMRQWIEHRNWRDLDVLSSCYALYNQDYYGETLEGYQMPMLNVFVKRGDDIYHTYGTEMLHSKVKSGDPRHVDLLWPLWNVLDLTPEGRGDDWYPQLDYPEPNNTA